ncbi:uncharacterized protein AB675_7245 [Cyphellophora attinorum]|uniref:Methyltransferase type 11 domain-containing protein n=1 Tax=Cyphellophora attinorum TaxID=1664694 RepID=A0A0N1GWL3_9EURO|nr:uncharacterized protein AB675_7245 [Phialophora attinorum]KPI34322.1 hypothetical protein AB675_7245 [Phialophora attinorum]
MDDATTFAAEDVPILFEETSLYEPFLPTPNFSQSFLGPDNDTVFGIAMPSTSQSHHQGELPSRLIPELRALAQHVPKQTRPPGPPSVSTVGSPSTRFTESPAPWSAGTATTTPLSWSSASPALTQTHGLRTPDRNKTVPQPTPPRSRLPRLPMKPKPATPSRDEQPSKTKPAVAEKPPRPRRKKSILDGAPPTPPTRTSSRGGRSANSSIDDTLSRTTPARPSTAPLSGQMQRATTQNDPQLRRMPSSGLSGAHDNLQSSISAAPARPSRSGTLDLGESRPAIINTHRAGFSPQQRQLLESGFEEVTRRTQPTLSSGAASDSEQSTPGDRVRRSPSRLGKFSRLKLFGTRDHGPRQGSPINFNAVVQPLVQVMRDIPNVADEISSTRRIPLFSHSRKGSTTSRRTSQADLDEFAVPRLRPVVMRGGSQTSVASAPLTQVAFSPPGRDDVPRMATTPPTDVYLQSLGQETRIQPATMPATSHDMRSGQKTLAARRSQRFQGASPPRLPTPIRIDHSASQPAVTSYDTTVSSNMSSSGLLSTASGQYDIDPTLLRDKKDRRKWWNPFRSRRSSATSAKPATVRTPGPEMAVSIAAGPAPRTIPYYAMLESESELNQAGVGRPAPVARMPTPPSPSPEDEPDRMNLPRGRESVLLPAAPSTDNLPLIEELHQRSASPLKQPRLAQVGRIPKVATRIERQHTPSRQSFSQPFSKPTSPTPQQHAFVEEPPQLQIHTDVLPSRPFREADNLSAKPFSAPARAQAQQVFSAETAMLPLEPVGSISHTDRSSSSVSAGLISVMGPAIVPAYTEQDIQPLSPETRVSVIDTEDVWNEYDDIIDHVMSPSRSRDEVPPELGGRQLPRTIVSTEYGSPVMKGVVSARPVSRGKMPVPEPRQAFLDLPLAGTDSPPVMLPSPSLPSTAGDEIRLRRSRIISALHSSYNPTSPFSMREFLKDYSDNPALSERLSTSTADARSTLIAAAHFDTDPVRDDHQHNAAMLDVVSRAQDPIKQSELHYASLEVSRWLSFGRVLFSPAQDEIFTLPDRAVLVIDGLGNEDWAIYCAVTYESTKAVVYDLKETNHYRKQPSAQELEHLPPNLRRAEIASFSERFPFHTAFFSVIVLRFPPAMSEATMKNVITECRRILVPGGHIEIMLLDLDFVNMGVQTRRAVRELKMRMTTKNPDVNLKPTIDHFQSVLGSRGFMGLSRCIVGVPVVGKAPGSTDSSTSSSRGSGDQFNPKTGSPSKKKGHGRNFSLSDLVTDSSERADAQIGRMVSKTARNWWQHCYEASVLPQGDASKSIFAEKRVLQECKARASSFKLLIAYAQRPVFESQAIGSRRRTASEPSQGMVSTAGTERRRRS